MATHHNFRIKNGLEVGGVLIVNSSGQLVVADINANQKFLDNVRLRFGDSSDYSIFHSNNGVTYLAGSTVEHGSNTWRVMNLAGTEAIIKGNADGNVELFHNGQSRFKTTAAGVQIPSSGTTIGWSNLANAWLLLGTSSAGIGIDNNEIMAKGVGSLYLGTGDSGDIVFRTNGTSARLTVKSAGDVEVHNSLDVGADLNVTGDLNITGDINSVSVTDLDVLDKTITLGKGQTESNSGSSGIIVDGSLAELLWDEGDNQWEFNKNVYTTGFINAASGISEFATAKVNAGGLRVHGGGTYTDPGSQMYLYADASGHGYLAVYDMYFYTGSNSSRTVQALKLTNTGDVHMTSGDVHLKDNAVLQFGNSSHSIQSGASHGGGDMTLTSSDDMWFKTRWARFQDIVGSAGEYARISYNGSWIYSTLTSQHIKPQTDSSYNLGEVNKRYATVFGDTGRFADLDIDNNVDIDGTLETDGLTVNNNPVYIRDEQGASVAGAGYYRVAANTVGGAGRGAFICTVYTTGGNYAPKEVVIQGHADWSSTETIHTVKSSAGNTYFTKARIVRESGDAFLEVYFYAAITDLEIETVDVGQAGWYSLSGALTAATGTETRTGPVTLIAPGLNTQEVINSTQGFQVNNQTVIDNSRNIENITTITTEGTATSGTIMDIRPSDTNQMFRVRFPDSSTMEMGTTRTGNGNVQKAVVYGQAGVDITTNGILRASMTQAGDFSLDADCGGLYFGGSTRSSATNAQAYIKESGLNLDIKGNDNVRLLGDGANVILFADYSGKVGIGTGTAASTIDEKFQVEGGNVKIEAGAVSTNRGLIIAHTGQTGNNTILEQYADGNPRGRLHTTERRLVIEAGSGGSTGANEKLELWTNASRAMTIDTSQNVGIGTASPYGLTHWQKSSTVNLVATNTGADGQADTTVMSLIGQARGYSNNLSKLASIDFKTDPTTWYYGAITFNVANLDGTDTSRTPLEAMRINRLGNVGIGTSSPASILHVKGTQSYGSIRVSPTSANGESAMAFFLDTAGTQTSNAWVVGHAGWGNTNDFVIGNQAFGGPVMLMQQDGKVGIGTTAPGAKLEIKDGDLWLNGATSSSNPEIFFIDDAGAGTAGAKIRYGNNDGNVYFDHKWNNASSGFFFRNRVDGTALNTMALVNGDVGIGTTSISARLHVSGAATPGNFAAIIQNSSGGGNVLKLYNHDWDDNDHLLQATNGGTGANGFAFTVDGQSKVGIGTTDPAGGFGLEIKGTTIYNADIKLNRGLSGTNHHGINWYNGTTKKAEISWGEGDANVKIRNFRNDSSASYARIDFDVGGSNYATNPDTRMVIQNTGLVGIGTTDPSQKLHVVGKAYATEGFTTDGFAKSYTWRAVDNSSNGGVRWVKICRVTATQSARFSIELTGRSTSYGDGAKPAFGRLVGQLNNDDNYDLTYYNYHTGSSEVVTEVGQVDIDTTSTDIYLKITSFSEIVAVGLISDGTILPTTGNTGASQGVGSAPTGYTAITAQKIIMENAAGSVGIGTTSPGRKLDVKGAVQFSVNTSTHETFVFTTQAANDAKQLMRNASSVDTIVLNTGGNTWLNGGNVGIGTTGPDAKLHVDGAGIIGGNQNKHTAPIAGLHIIDDTYSKWSGTLSPEQCALRVETYYNGSDSHPRAAGDYGGGIVFNHLGGHSTTHGDNMHCWIGPRVWDTPGRERSGLVFATNDDTSTQPAAGVATIEERMVIDPYGKVGIGTGAPDSPLSILGATGLGIGASGIRVHRPDSFGQFGYLDYGQSSGTTYIGSSYTGSNSSTYGVFRFRQHSNGGAVKDTLTISENNLVGIANTNPGYLLEVGDAANTNSNVFSGRVNGDFIFNLSRASTNLFSIRNNGTGIVHLNTQNSSALGLGVSTSTGTGTLVSDLLIDSTAVTVQGSKILRAAGAPGFKIGASAGSYERFFNSSYGPNGTANQMYKLNLGNSGGLSGVLEITVQGTYSHQDVSGYVKRTTNIGLNQNGSIWRNSLISVEQFGQAAEGIVIGPVQWDSSASQYYVNIYKISSAGNAFTVGVKLTTHSASDGGLSTWTLSNHATLAAPTGYTSRYDTNARPQNVNRQYITDTSSEAFRVAGNVNAGEFDLPSGGMVDWANGDARIIEGNGENYSLSLQTYDGSTCNTNTRFDGDNSVHHFGSEFSFLNNKIDMHSDSTPNGLSAAPTMRIGDFSRGTEELQFNVSSNGSARICFKDSNWSEGTYIKSNGDSYGGKIYFGAMWDDEEDKIVMDLRQSSAGASYDARMGINNTNPQSTLDVGGDIRLTGSIIGNSSNTTEVGTYSTGGIKRIRMTQGGELHFGDTTTANFLGITEGAVNNFSDQDRIGIYFRNEMKFYSNSNTLRHTFDASGNYTAVGNVTAYSDIRLKDDLQPIEDAVSKVQKLKGVTYIRNDNDDENRQAGLIAQDVELVLPEAVRETEDGTKTVNYNATIALLVESIKEQQTLINRLEKRINTLENNGE